MRPASSPVSLWPQLHVAKGGRKLSVENSRTILSLQPWAILNRVMLSCTAPPLLAPRVSAPPYSLSTLITRPAVLVSQCCGHLVIIPLNNGLRHKSSHAGNQLCQGEVISACLGWKPESSQCHKERKQPWAVPAKMMVTGTPTHEMWRSKGNFVRGFFFFFSCPTSTCRNDSCSAQ